MSHRKWPRLRSNGSNWSVIRAVKQYFFMPRTMGNSKSLIFFVMQANTQDEIFADYLLMMKDLMKGWKVNGNVD